MIYILIFLIAFYLMVLFFTSTSFVTSFDDIIDEIDTEKSHFRFITNEFNNLKSKIPKSSLESLDEEFRSNYYEIIETYTSEYEHSEGMVNSFYDSTINSINDLNGKIKPLKNKLRILNLVFLLVLIVLSFTSMIFSFLNIFFIAVVFTVIYFFLKKGIKSSYTELYQRIITQKECVSIFVSDYIEEIGFEHSDGTLFGLFQKLDRIYLETLSNSERQILLTERSTKKVMYDNDKKHEEQLRQNQLHQDEQMRINEEMLEELKKQNNYK